MVSDAKACFSSKVEYRAVIQYLYLKGKTGKEIHGESTDVQWSSAPSYAQVKFWVGEFKRGGTSLEDEKKVRQKSRECHNHKPQPFPDPKRKRKPTNLNKHKPNKRTKSTKISSLFPNRGNRTTKKTEKHQNKMTHGKTQQIAS